jgi:hypothetical protein
LGARRERRQRRAKQDGASRQLIHLNRDSPDEPRTVVDFCAFAAFWQDRLAARTIAVILGTPNGDRGADLAILASIWTYSSRQLLLNA